MVAPVLTEGERVALENLAASGPERGLDPALRGRLALYRLIDEVPEGWTITPLGQARGAGTAPPTGGDARTQPADGARHYGRKSRDTSWLD
jgi:hypothetical protein